MSDFEPLYLIVDDDNPSDQAARLLESLKLAGLPGRVEFARSPAEMLEFLKETTPDGIVLDHHWPEVKIERVLQDVLRRSPMTRVVLYTGKSLDPSTILECARFGVAEYLAKGSVSGDTLAKKLALLTQDDNKTIEKLSKPSGAVQQLIQETEKTVQELESERALRRTLEMQVSLGRREAAKEIWGQIIRFFSVTLYVCAAIAAILFAAGGDRQNKVIPIVSGFVALAGLLILDKSISQLSAKIWNSQLSIKR